MNHEGRMYREGDPDTSIEAAEHVDATRLEAMVLEAVSKYPNGCIQDDVLNVYRGMPYSSITARFISLKRKGCIVYTGEKRVGRSGRNQRVMQITEQGLIND